MPKVNQEEYKLLKEIKRNGFEEIRRNSTGDIAVRGTGEKVTSHQYQAKYNDKFKFLEATGDYWSIAELIEEYEYSAEHVSHVVNERVRMLGKAWSESEETEMKTLESIREEIWEEMLRLEDKREYHWADIKYQTLREVLQKLGHLDEPEVLSQEWIDEHAEHHEYIGYAGVPVDDLQNLLVPKWGGHNQQAYRDGFREGERQTAEYFESITEEPSKEQVWKYLSEHGIEVVDKEPETVASVIVDFYKSLERLKGVLGTEVEEMEE